MTKSAAIVTVSPLAVIREARRSLEEWLDAIGKSPDPAAECKDKLPEVAATVAGVARALREAPPELAASETWRKELAAYGEALRAVRAKLASFEVTLRIRRVHIGHSRAHLNALSAWAALTREIG
jgi:hypothetical protein